MSKRKYSSKKHRIEQIGDIALGLLVAVIIGGIFYSCAVVIPNVASILLHDQGYCVAHHISTDCN